MTDEVEKKGTKGCPQAKEILEREVSCLECPLPSCLLDFTTLKGKKIRNERILKLFKEGKSKREIARTLKVTTWTIRRVLTPTKEEITNVHQI